MSNKIQYGLFYTILSLAALASIFNVFRLTPIADDYWYADSVLQHGLFGSIADMLSTLNGLVFKESVINLLMLPVAFLPIGIGSGVSYLFVAFLTTCTLIYIIKNVAKDFWHELKYKNKILLLLTVFVTFFTSNSVIYKNATTEALITSNNFSYDLTFWVSMQMYYLSLTSILIAWFILIQKNHANKKLALISILFFGIAIGTTNHILVGIFITSATLWNILYKIWPNVVFNYKIKHYWWLFAATVIGVLLAFSFPSTLSRGHELMSYKDPSLTFWETLLNTTRIGLVNFFSEITNPSMFLSAALIFIISSTFFKKHYTSHQLFLKLGVLALALSILSFFVTTLVDSIVVSLQWHHQYMLYFLKISYILFAIGFGLKTSSYVKSKFAITAAVIIFTIIMSATVYANISTVTERASCWKLESCPVGYARDIELDWIYNHWIVIQKHFNLPDRARG